MKKKYQITEEEFEAITKAVENVLQLWQYDLINVSNDNDNSLGMSKETFFDQLKDEFIIYKD